MNVLDNILFNTLVLGLATNTFCPLSPNDVSISIKFCASTSCAFSLFLSVLHSNGTTLGGSIAPVSISSCAFTLHNVLPHTLVLFIPLSLDAPLPNLGVAVNENLRYAMPNDILATASKKFLLVPLCASS